MHTRSYAPEELSGRQRELPRAAGLIDIQLMAKVKKLWTGSKTTDLGRRELNCALR